MSDTRWSDRIRDRVVGRRDDIVHFAQEIIRVPSETHPPGGDEGPVQRVVEAKLRSLGCAVDVFEPWAVAGADQHEGWWPGFDYTDRPNVVGTWGVGRSGRTLILNGHIDVVPSGPVSEWTGDPYGAELRDGAIWGRGAADMKAGVAAMIMAVDILQDIGFEVAGQVILESVVNEELGGYNGTVACCVRGYQGDGAIVLEPTELAIAPASKGGQVYHARVRGHAAHSSFWWTGTSALDKALIVKDALGRWQRLRSEECRTAPFFGDASPYPVPAFADTIWALRAGDPQVMANPESAEFSFWVDVLPEESREDVLARFEKFVHDAARSDPFLAEHPVELSRASMRPFFGNGVSPQHPLVTSLRSAAHRTGCGSPLVGFPAACDAMIFNVYSSTPALVFGPGNLALAHAPDEHVPIEQLLRAVEILALTIVDFCGGN